MSLGARATKGGGRGKDRGQDKGKPDKSQPKEKVKPQATTEQLRLANMIDRKADDTADVRKMVKMVQDLMEMTCRTEEEVCSALHDSDNDVMAACNLLLEAEKTGEWQTSEKKKKKPSAATNNGEAEPREPRSRSGPRPRRGEGERGERGEGSTRGRGSGRGGRGAGRGGRGGARGGRGGPRPRPDRTHDWPHHPQPSDSNPLDDTFPATEDWDNEEWSGSLSDTKVFTPSVNSQPAMDGDSAQPLPATAEEWEAPEPPVVVEGHIPTFTYHNPAAHHATMELGGVEPPAVPAQLPPDFLHQHQHQHQQQHQQHQPQHQHQQQHQHQGHAVQPRGMSGSLTAAQSQYLEQLTQQSQRHDTSVYTTNYGVYGAADITNHRKPQRARVPPPSKIPSSAVEMPGGAGAEGVAFLDVQFGALDDLPDPPKPSAAMHMPVSPPAPTEPAPAPHDPSPHPEPAPVSYANANAMLNESLSAVEASAVSQAPPAPAPAPAPAPEPPLTNSTSSLEKQLSASMKQLSAADAPPLHLHLQHHRPKPAPASTNASGAVNASSNTNVNASVNASASAAANAAQNMYSHHPVSHHPPAVYSANVYAPQVNSSNASLSAAAALPQAYPSSVTLTQYQPIINSYQTSSSAGVYNSSALYTAAQYTPYQPPAAAMPKHQPKDNAPQYDSSAVTVSNSLTSTSTTQTSTAKVTTTSGHVPVTGVSSSGGAAGYAGGALYGSQGYAAYDEQLMRSTMPHHMGGYYEVTGYGVGVGGGARDGAFGMGAGDRFARSDAASPQQVPTAALPPGYAYYYQPPPPTTYQYGVYPNVSDLRVQFGGGSGVGGAGGGKVPAYQQPQYDAQDSYKPGGGYTGSASKSGAAAADLSNAMYAKGHVTLNKVNSYEKAGFHSGTPPPFGAASHLYIAAPPHHHHHAPQQHQMDARMNSSQNRRAESGTSGGRGGNNKPAHNKPAYTHSYWPTN